MNYGPFLCCNAEARRVLHNSPTDMHLLYRFISNQENYIGTAILEAIRITMQFFSDQCTMYILQGLFSL